MTPLDTYWLEPGRILAGEYPGDRYADGHADGLARHRLACLREAGVEAIVDLTEEDEGLLPYAHLLDGISHQRFPIEDVSVPRNEQTMVAILDAIDGHARGKVVYVHCLGGVGRTGTVAGCYPVRHGLDRGDAIARLAELRAGCRKAHRLSPETPEQTDFVHRWRRGL